MEGVVLSLLGVLLAGRRSQGDSSAAQRGVVGVLFQHRRQSAVLRVDARKVSGSRLASAVGGLFGAYIPNSLLNLPQQGVLIAELQDKILFKALVLLHRLLVPLQMFQFRGSVELRNGQHVLPVD